MQSSLMTDRLILWTISLADASDMYEYAKLDVVGPQAGWHPHESLYETKEVIASFLHNMTQGRMYAWAICLKSTKKMIGTIELYNLRSGNRYEMGYSLNPAYWNNGYTSEAAQKIVQFAFTKMNCRKLEVGMYPNNLSSIKVALKAGLKYEGTLKLHYERAYDQKLFDEAFYGLTKEEYEKEVAHEEN